MGELSKYTHRGTERIIKRPEPQTPTDGFIDLMGQEVFDSLCDRACTGQSQGPFHFLKRIETQGVTCVSGYIQHGPRRIYFTLRFADPEAFEVVSYGCDPVFAVPPETRVEYVFEPRMDADWSFQMRREVLDRFAMVKAVHEREAEQMNVQLHFGDTLKARVKWEAYAAKHGLKIVAKESAL